MRQRDESDVPPAVKCAVCGGVECPGCAPAHERKITDSAMPWESETGTWHQRLWRTAIATSIVPARTFGELPDGSIGPALVFAFAAEAVAIGSLGAAFALAGWAVAPELCGRLLASPEVTASVAALTVLATVGMVALHVLCGLCIELGAQTSQSAAKFRQGVRFGLYACGWDLLTSPAGIVQGVASRGLYRAWGPIVEAVRAPRPALLAYAEICRRMSPEARRRGERLTALVLAGFGLALLVAAIAAALWFAARIG